MSDPVVRELTAPGRGGVAVLEVLGPGALERVRALCPDVSLAPGRLVLARIGSRSEALDEALVAVLDPERVELHLHGNPSLVRAVGARLGCASAPRGQGGLEALAAGLCASVPSEAGARILLDQAEGALRREVRALRAAPSPEQDRRLDTLLSQAPVVQRTLRPSLVLLAGPTNAGKSTLFNALVGARRVLVSAEVGTTRDVVVERARLGAYPVDLADAPGERAGTPTAGDRALELEREGGRIARTLLERADLVLWLSPAHAPADPPATLPVARLVVLSSQVDRLAGGPAVGPSLSALLDPAAAAACVEGLFRDRLGLPVEPWRPGGPALFAPGLVALARRAREAQGAARASLLAALEVGAAQEEGGEAVEAGGGWR